MKNYDLKYTKSLVINGMINLVTPNIKHCEISCIVRYNRLQNSYVVSIGTRGPLGGFIRLGKSKVLDLVKGIFTQGTGSIIRPEYNGHNYVALIDRSKD